MTRKYTAVCDSTCLTWEEIDKKNEDYERQLKKYQNVGIRDDSSNSASPPPSKKQKVEEMNTANQDK